MRGQEDLKIMKNVNVIDTNLFSAERGGQSDLFAPYNRDQIGFTIAKQGSSPQNLPTMPKYGSTPPPP